MGIKVVTIPVGQIDTNCYLTYDEDIRKVVITDPGADADRIIAKIDELQLKPVAIMLTHAHWDHILAARKMKEKYFVPLYMNTADEFYLEDRQHVDRFGIELKIDDVDEDFACLKGMEAGGMNIEVILTPGHTEGGTSLYYKDAGFVLAGDTMFYHSWGRTDLPLGSDEKIRESLRTLMQLPDETVVYPGHGRPTTIKEEKAFHRRFC